MKQSDHERTQVSRSAANALDTIADDAIPAAVVGFDGFIDWIARIVDQRTDMSPEGYEPIRTIKAYAARCAAASGKSTNLEIVDVEQRWGGNGPLFAGAMATLGTPTTYIGAVGTAADPTRLDPLFQPFAARCRRVIPIAPPGRTDAFEFDDGKLMFNRTANVQRVGWKTVRDAVGIDQLIELMSAAPVLGLVNWSLMGEIEGVWQGLIDDIFPRLTTSRNSRSAFVDLSDPAKRSDADVAQALNTLKTMQTCTSVTLGLNLAEAQRIATVTKVRYDENNLDRVAKDILAAIGIGCVVIHPRHGAAAADETGDSAWFDGPIAARPVISTGAGDHFNGGFMFARSSGLSLAESLAAGCATSGWYVRKAASPTRPELVQFLQQLPGPEPSR